jgi:rhodanese-related sulfurtransferase
MLALSTAVPALAQTSPDRSHSTLGTSGTSATDARRALATGSTPTLQLIVSACDFGDRAGPGSTPPTIPGAATVSAREAKCIIETLGYRIVVLAAVHDSRRLPGARDVDWANSGGPEDSNQVPFAAMLSRVTNGDRQRPLLIYCHNENCPLSSVVVRRAVAAGYSVVFWMRQGIDGWSRAGFAFETAG